MPLKEMHCDKDDCFIKNNWFGASPYYAGNAERYKKCLNCKLPKKEKSK